MCAIAGIHRIDGGPVTEAELGIMMERLVHRGPDGEGTLVRGATALGHRRLKIIDLSDLGRQPMANEDGTSWLVFNGEIYNYLELHHELAAFGHLFRSKSDSEVILHAYEQWGASCLERFVGMFALVLWDARTNELFCARDRFGIKPFHYYWDGKTFLFASEAKALLAHPLVRSSLGVNHAALKRVVSTGIVAAGAETCYTNVHTLEPAHFLKVSGEKLTKTRYWKVEHFADVAMTDADATEQFQILLADSLRLHLRSDVPLGVLLSGGLDSSALVCLAVKEYGARFKAFSIYYPRADKYDERRYAQEVTRVTGVDTQFITVSSPEISELIHSVCYHHDFPVPFSSAASTFMLHRCARRNGITVLLDGEGPDEFLGGYDTCFPFHLGELLRKSALVPFVQSVLSIRRARDLGAVGVARLVSKGLVASILSERNAYRLREAMKPSLLCGDLSSATTWDLIGEIPADKLTQFLYNLTFSSNLETLLQFEDRNSMASSLELRVPYLDHRLVEWAFRLPPHFKIRNGRTKWILRESMRGIVPDMVLNRTDKMGLNTPGESSWLKEELKEEFEDLLGSAAFRSRGIYNYHVIGKLRKRYAAGEERVGEDLWKVYALEKWFRLFVDTLQPVTSQPSVHRLQKLQKRVA